MAFGRREYDKIAAAIASCKGKPEQLPEKLVQMLKEDQPAFDVARFKQVAKM